MSIMSSRSSRVQEVQEFKVLAPKSNASSHKFDNIMKTNNNNNIYENNHQFINTDERMSSLEIATLTGKAHSDVMKAIRKMERAWTEVCEGKFSLTSRTVIQPNGGVREVPCYMLTKMECLYIATKFNDEARARLVLRWQELEMAERERQTAEMRLLESRAMLLEEICDTLKPKAEFTDAVLCSEDTLTVTQMAQDYGVGAVRFNRLLEVLHIQHRVGGQWVLFAPHQGRGYVHSYTTYHVSTKEGYIRTQLFTRWTQLGRRFLYERLRREGILPNTLRAPRQIITILGKPTAKGQSPKAKSQKKGGAQ